MLVVHNDYTNSRGVLTLLPPSWEELKQFPTAPNNLLDALWQGSYPRIYDRTIPASRWLSDYVSAYVQRDVRQVTRVTDLNSFTTFLKLCAGQTGQEINYSKLGNDSGISHNTARSWLSVLETSWLTLALPAWHRNVRKQVVKAPKLHFLDSGLVCHLLGIRNAEELRHHPLRGAIFESWVVAELFKQFTNRGEKPALYHYREARGLEIDILLEQATHLDLVEVKAGSTVNSHFFKNLLSFQEHWADNKSDSTKLNAWLVYGGNEQYKRQGCWVRGWEHVADISPTP